MSGTLHSMASRSSKVAHTQAKSEAHRKLRQQLQEERPGIDALLASGEYEGPLQQGDVFARLGFAAQLKSTREALGLSLSDLSERTGIDKSAISRLENGTSPNPTLRTLERLASALEMRLSVRLCELEAKGAAGRVKG